MSRTAVSARKGRRSVVLVALALAAPLLAAPFTALAQSQATASASALPADPWPRAIDLSNAAVLVYQPQVGTWNGNALDFRAALAIKPAGAANETYGVTSTAFTAWQLGTTGFNEPTFSQSVVKDLRAWHTYGGAAWLYPSNNLLFDSTVYRADVAGGLPARRAAARSPGRTRDAPRRRAAGAPAAAGPASTDPTPAGSAEDHRLTKRRA